mgnify:CR=1 FL=1
MFDLINKLCGTFGVSGNEEEIRSLIAGEIIEYVDEIFTDTLGNLIAVKRGNGKKIMYAAHMDEIGVMATHIDDNGFIRFSNVGWVSPQYSLGQRVRFKNGTQGVVFYEQKEELKNLKLSNMYIDIGAKNKEETEKKVKIGDTACFVGSTYKQENVIISKALDNRIGCAVLIKAIKEIETAKNELYFVFTVQEELGLRGAKTAAYKIMPDFAVVVDVTETGDTPECKTMEVKLGNGPAIKIKDNSVICHPFVKNILENKAKEIGIPYQYEILEEGGSDTGSILLTGGGIPAGAVSIPCRYVHSPSEMISVEDAENAVKLIKAAADI